MIKEIVKVTDRAQEFSLKDNPEVVNQIKEDLGDTLKNSDRYFLCSNEIGYTERCIAIKFGDEIRYFFNPVYQSKKDIKFSREVDLNTNKEYLVPRFDDTAICFINDEGKILATRFTHDSSIVLGRAMDILDDIDISSYGMEILETYDQLSDEEREELIRWYFSEHLKLEESVLDEQLMADDEVRNEWIDLKFRAAQSLGEVEVERTEPKLNRKQRRWLNKLSKKLRRGKKND